jgi:uncharacterized protein YbjT (DUF2867 family)
MADNTQEKTTLVLGGTGKTGRRVAKRLTAQGLPVRIGSRTGEPPFNWENHDTWAPALHGIEAAYVSYYPDLAAPGAPAAIRSFTDLPAAAGVRRLVLLSGRGEHEAQACEQVVQESGAEWTIVRSSWFCQNFSEDYLLEPVLGGEVALPVGDIPEPFVDAEDIAAVAVAALTQDGHAGQVYELTGPRALTFDEAITQIAKATGRDIHFVRVSPEEYAAALAKHAVPAEVIALMTYLFTTVLDGRNAHVTDGVKRALGSEPKDFTDYPRDTAATGVWGR